MLPGMTTRGATLLPLLSGLFGLCVAGLPACAPSVVMIDGVAVPRQNIPITGQAISVKHTGAHPRPGTPSGGLKADGGSIGGLVCGMQVDYDVTHAGDHIQLIGFIDGTISTQIQIREVGGERVVNGNLGRLALDLRFSPTMAKGRVGTRWFDVQRDGNRYLGGVRIPGIVNADGTDSSVPLVIDGADVFDALPAADQAALLPNVLTCFWSVSASVADALHVGFGGEASALPSNTSHLYSGR